MKERMNSVNTSKIQEDRLFVRNFERLFALCEKCFMERNYIQVKSTKERNHSRYMS